MAVMKTIGLLLLVSAALGAGAAGDAVAARNVELLHGTVRSGSHAASGRAAVVLVGGRRVLTLRGFRIAPGPRVRVLLVPRSVRGDGDVRRDFKDLGVLKGNRGNQQYAIGAAVDLRRYRSVIFWCVPFTSTLARANLTRS
jgi:electron transfer DM13